jgi:hypothetical protein
MRKERMRDRRTPFMKAISKTLMPVSARSLKAIECLEDNKGMTLKVAKLRAGNYMYMIPGFDLKVGVPNIYGPCFKAPQFAEKHECTQTAKRDSNSGVNTIYRYCHKVSVGNHPYLVSAVLMLAVIDQVDMNLHGS